MVQRFLRFGPLVFLLSGCGGTVTGSLSVSEVVEDSTIVGIQVRFSASEDGAANTPGQINLAFQSVGAELLFDASTSGTDGCVPLPSTNAITLLGASESGIPSGTRIRVSAWDPPDPEEPAEGSDAEPEPVEPCSGILITDTVWTATGTTTTSSAS